MKGESEGGSKIDRSQKRYLVRGFIDGLLSTLGAVIGASAAIGTSSETSAASVILSAGVGAGIANGLSNVLAAFMGEKLVVVRRLEEVERAMLEEEALRKSRVADEIHQKIISGGMADGLATIGGAMVPVLPFVFVPLLAIKGTIALYSSIILSLVSFFVLGGYIGKVSRENVIFSGLKMAAFAGVTAIICKLVKMALV
ncbi:hypothetical protein AKJ64_02390 [candidate division MSBL1 archaeon SCGC-AAA259E17]|uniref:TIGR00267 family protein n=1 Tax=candidate division MSBL1 archaeon SCGC-AAA259E17 TaxID=1698263 RepID=A0A133UET8_9EURY|nr:hypothetical protein AKJ64_02390 [candidate division MSBL1 archaeon SCGC-AAA259E17]